MFELNIDDCKVTVATVLLLITTAPPRVEALFFVNVLEASTAAVQRAVQFALDLLQGLLPLGAKAVHTGALLDTHHGPPYQGLGHRT